MIYMLVAGKDLRTIGELGLGLCAGSKAIRGPGYGSMVKQEAGTGQEGERMCRGMGRSAPIL